MIAGTIIAIPFGFLCNGDPTPVQGPNLRYDMATRDTAVRSAHRTFQSGSRHMLARSNNTAYI